MASSKKTWIEIALLGLRLWVGANFLIAHGWAKLSDPRAFLDGEAMDKFPSPEVFGWAAIVAEVGGGALLILGLATRIASAAVLGTMLGAAFVVHGADPWMAKEPALTYAVCAVVLALGGPGMLSVDEALERRRKAYSPW